MLQISFGELEYAYRVVVGRLVSMLHRDWSHSSAELELLAGIPVAD